NKVVPHSELMETAQRFAKTVSGRGPIAVAQAKKAVNEGFDESLSNGLKREANLFGKLFSTQDQKEGTTAFIEKRQPNFTGE
ncbi:enoyl-CoA hydratase/isomerase family protein, partial [Klebsiella pneumoniae]|uniref:enoyl-CoA hydratase/isomerase family protein n=1 Tax=Klebsiella pneumoniae TaxID=573 RepID=UPI001E2AB181